MALSAAWQCLILALVFLTAFLTVTVRTNLVGRQIDSLTEEFYLLTSKLGFTLDDILIEGRKKTSRRTVMEVLGLKRGDNILSLDLNELKNRIETLPWGTPRRHSPQLLSEYSAHQPR